MVKNKNMRAAGIAPDAKSMLALGRDIAEKAADMAEQDRKALLDGYAKIGGTIHGIACRAGDPLNEVKKLDAANAMLWGLRDYGVLSEALATCLLPGGNCDAYHIACRMLAEGELLTESHDLKWLEKTLTGWPDLDDGLNSKRPIRCDAWGPAPEAAAMAILVRGAIAPEILPDDILEVKNRDALWTLYNKYVRNEE